MKRPCAHCGELYEPSSGLARHPRKYCSSDCVREAHRARAVAKYPSREEILALYEQGASDRSLAERYGHSYQWVLNVRKHYGISASVKPFRKSKKGQPGVAPTRWSHSHGYVKVTGDRLEHRVVMEEKLGRPLRKGEEVHHIDGDKTNNDPENLALFPSHSEHMYAERIGSRNQPTRKYSDARARRDWTEPRRKVDLEESCRVCGRSGIKIDAAHIIPRSRVGPDEGEHFDNIVPLCHERCHPAFDLGELDLVPYLTLTEQAYATKLVGMAEAYQRLTNTRLAA